MTDTTKLGPNLFNRTPATVSNPATNTHTQLIHLNIVLNEFIFRISYLLYNFDVFWNKFTQARPPHSKVPACLCPLSPSQRVVTPPSLEWTQCRLCAVTRPVVCGPRHVV